MHLTPHETLGGRQPTLIKREARDAAVVAYYTVILSVPETARAFGMDRINVARILREAGLLQW